MPDTSGLTAEFDKAQAALQQLWDEEPDTHKRLAIRKEMNKLLRLYTCLLETEADDGGESETLTEIRGHLEPLGLAPEGTPLPELARLAALRITEK